MTNLDLMQQRKNECLQALADAIKEGDTGAMQEAMKNLGEYYSDTIKQAMTGVVAEADRTILAGRGIRQLTASETKYYQEFIQAAKSANPKQAISNIDAAFPQTVIDSVLEDIEAEHPLLDAITFENTGVLSKVVVNAKGTQQSKWGAINSAITEQIQGAIEAIDVTACKLTAFMYISMDMLEAGPVWVDRYVRGVLTDALAVGLEDGIINGEGKDEPIGMIMDLAGGPDGTTGKYSAKTATAVTELTPTTYGAILAGLAVAPVGSGEEEKYRNIENVIMVVNPADYLSIVIEEQKERPKRRREKK